MKISIIITLILALVLAQGMRLCVHDPVAGQDEAALTSLVHYESDSIEHNIDDGGHDFSVAWIMQGADVLNLLTGLSILALFLISLLLAAYSGRRFVTSPTAALAFAEGFRLRPPLRAPPR